MGHVPGGGQPRRDSSSIPLRLIMPDSCRKTAFICYNYENILLTYSEVVMRAERRSEIEQKAG
jgi:hypothetical protein